MQNSFTEKMWFREMKFIKTLVNFQKNPKEPSCNILQRVKFLSLTKVSDLNSHRSFNLYSLHYGFMVKAVDEILIISVFIQIKDTR